MEIFQYPYQQHISISSVDINYEEFRIPAPKKTDSAYPTFSDMYAGFTSSKILLGE